MGIKPKRKILLLTGQRNIGKTRICQELIRLIRTRKKVTGIITPGEYINGRRVAIFAEDIRSSEKKKFAEFMPGWDEENPKREWKFLEDALLWGNMVIMRSIPTEILIIDEIGYLELEKNEGWNSIFQVIQSGQFEHALLVVRPDLVPRAFQLWSNADIIELSAKKDAESIKKYMVHQLLQP